MLKNHTGDWVAHRFASGDLPGKVVEGTHDYVKVRFRFEGQERDLVFEHPLPRIRWRRARGRSIWSYL